MATSVTASGRDLRALAAIVSQDRPDLPDGAVLPPSLLADLKDQIPCDDLSIDRQDSGRQAYSVLQSMSVRSDDELEAFWDSADWERFWACHWECRFCSYPERTGDLRSVVKISDLYSARQWHRTGMYSDIFRPQGYEHQLQLCLPDPAGPNAGPGGTVRMHLFRGPGLDFTDRDRMMKTLLGPKWRNWQTRMIQGHVPARVWGFESPLRHHRHSRTSSID